MPNGNRDQGQEAMDNKCSVLPFQGVGYQTADEPLTTPKYQPNTQNQQQPDH
jgi:hypothetical protein